jgi:hypothetical protein
MLAALKKAFGHTWFGAAEAKKQLGHGNVTLAQLKRLVERGLLDSSKPPYAGPLSFRVKT